MNAPAAHVAHHKWQPNTPDGQGTPFLFQHGKAAASSAGGAFLRILKGQTGPGSEESIFPQAMAFAATGIRSTNVVAITRDQEIITGTSFFTPLQVFFILCETYFECLSFTLRRTC